MTTKAELVSKILDKTPDYFAATGNESDAEHHVRSTKQLMRKSKDDLLAILYGDEPEATEEEPVAAEPVDTEVYEAALALAGQADVRAQALAAEKAGTKPTRWKATDDQIAALVKALLATEPGMSKSAAELTNYRLLGASCGQQRWYAIHEAVAS